MLLELELVLVLLMVLTSENRETGRQVCWKDGGRERGTDIDLKWLAPLKIIMKQTEPECALPLRSAMGDGTQYKQQVG